MIQTCRHSVPTRAQHYQCGAQLRDSSIPSDDPNTGSVEVSAGRPACSGEALHRLLGDTGWARMICSVYRVASARDGCNRVRSQGDKMHRLLIIVTLLASIMASYAQAGMVSTQSVINAGAESYTQQQLQTALASDQLRAQLAELGVDADQLSDRVASLTPDEIVRLNAELEQQPAGGIEGLLLTVFIVFIITDMLCATDIFSFVKCINK